jgi:hypothetical protein
MGVSRLFLHIFLVIATCVPLVLLVADMAQRYPLDRALMEISLVDAVLLIVALGLPLCALSRLGVDWRTGAEEN